MSIKSEMVAVEKAVAEKDHSKLFEMATRAKNEEIRAYAVREYVAAMPVQFDKTFRTLYKSNLGFSSKVRRIVLKEIASMANGDKQFTALFVDALEKDSDAKCLIAALRGLSVNLKGEAFPSIPNAVLESEDADVRVALLCLVESCASGDRSGDVVEKYLRDRSMSVVQKAAEVAGAKGVSGAKAPLLAIAKSTVFDEQGLDGCKVAALRALNLMAADDADVVAVTETCMKSDNPKIRGVVLELRAKSSQRIDSKMLTEIIEGLSSSDRILERKSEKLLKASMPQVTEQLIEILSRDSSFVQLDICAALGLSPRRFELFDLLTRRLRAGSVRSSGRFSRTREFLYYGVLPSSDYLLDLCDSLAKGDKVELPHVTREQAAQVLSFLEQTDAHFTGQKQVWRSNRKLVGPATLLLALSNWEVGQKEKSEELFSTITQRYFDEPCVRIPRTMGTVHAIAGEEFRVSTASCLGIYSAMILAEFYLHDGKEEGAIRIMQDAMDKAGQMEVYVSDAKYDELMRAYVDSISKHEDKTVDLPASAKAAMRARFKSESMDIRLSMNLLGLYQKRGEKVLERALLQRQKNTWPNTLRRP